MKVLNNIFVGLPKKKKRKIVGRGVGSGRGRSSCRGHDGYNSRSGSSLGLYEGGQQPIHRRLPKRGFSPINRSKNRYEVVTTAMVGRFFESGKISEGVVLDVDLMHSIGLISRIGRVKLLYKGDLGFSASFVVDAASGRAVSAVESAGGSVRIVE